MIRGNKCALEQQISVFGCAYAPEDNRNAKGEGGGLNDQGRNLGNAKNEKE